MKHQMFAISFAAVSTLGALTSPLFAQTVERTVDVKVIKAKEIGPSVTPTFDMGKFFADFPDFYVVPTIDGQQLSRSKTDAENPFPTFNHKVASKVPLSKARIPIMLKLMDSDTIDDDDMADISPLPGVQALLLNYEPSTGKVYGPDGKLLGGRGEEIPIEGDKRYQVAEITFAISHKDAPASSPQPSEPPKEPSCPVVAPNCQPK